MSPLFAGQHLIEDARRLEAADQLEQAAAVYRALLEGVADDPLPVELVDACLSLSKLAHRLGDSDGAVAVCKRALAAAAAAAAPLLEAEATNVIGVIELDRGSLDRAEASFRSALDRADGAIELRGRIEQNLGIIANIRGEWQEAQRHYRASLDAFLVGRNAKGCGIAYHNLGMIYADRREWDQAEWYFTLGLELARSINDRYLQGLCLLNNAEVHLVKRRLREAAADADDALRIFQTLGSKVDVAEAQRQLGMIHAESGRPDEAERLLSAALDLAVATRAPLVEAECCRALALLYRAQNRNRETLVLLNRAYTLFRRLDARPDLAEVEGRVRDLEDTFFAAVLDWGQSIESADRYTYGHCNRVAEYAVALATALGRSDDEVTTIRLGAYLHDLGKVKVPEDILNKPGRLTPEEFETIKRHPVDGLEMLDGIEFPWDLKPIIRWHHEKYDGSGYPDGLVGDAIPLSAQIIGIADFYDALTTARSYRPALPPDAALALVHKSAGHWRPEVVEAFLALAPSFASLAGEASAPVLLAAAA
jgi:putative nucleotidyltransferase with HDIG domain